MKVDIKIGVNEMKRIDKFVKARCKDSDLYQKRGGFKEVDIRSGAMAEVAVYTFLKDLGFKVKKPDFTILDRKKKSYEADLTDGVNKWHVKGQTLSSAKRYGYSWIMQRWDPLVKNTSKEPNFLHYNYLVPCVVDIENKVVKILGTPSFSALHRCECFEECKVPSFRTTKVALYFDSIRRKMNNCVLWAMIKKQKSRLKRAQESAKRSV